MRALGVVLLLVVAAGCSEESSSGGDAPLGPAARVAGVLDGGNGIHLAGSAPPLPAGFVETEYAVEGTAVAYTSADELPQDGVFELSEAERADFRTRIVVRRPQSAADFNGTVVVEWLNVSAGLDASPDYTFMAAELHRGGYAWVGVSVQFIGIEGGPVLVSTPGGEEYGAGVGLAAFDPARYGELFHPGDAFAYDIYTQVARLLRAGSDGVLGELAPTRVLAVGESQSAFMLTTYANGVHPLAHAVDGFLIHSRGGGTAPLGSSGSGIDLLSGITAQPTRIRSDLDVPVLVLESETDMLFLLDYFPARQDDGDRFRTWEMAGTAHADAFLLGDASDLLDCGVPINAGPQHFMVKAALRHLDAWSRGGSLPPSAARLEIDSGAFVRDADGIVLGGIRTPLVDAPLDVLSGEPTPGSVACSLFGSTTPLSPARIAELYPSADAYLAAFGEAADAAVAAGFVLPEDREALLATADPSRVP